MVYARIAPALTLLATGRVEQHFVAYYGGDTARVDAEVVSGGCTAVPGAKPKVPGAADLWVASDLARPVRNLGASHPIGPK